MSLFYIKLDDIFVKKVRQPQMYTPAPELPARFKRTMK